MKVRRKEGKEYPSKTLYNISCGILRYFCAREIQNMNFLDRVDPRFPGFRKNLESSTINAWLWIYHFIWKTFILSYKSSVFKLKKIGISLGDQ